MIRTERKRKRGKTWEITSYPIFKVFPKLPQFLKCKESNIPVMLIDLLLFSLIENSSNKSDVKEHLETHF